MYSYKVCVFMGKDSLIEQILIMFSFLIMISAIAMGALKLLIANTKCDYNTGKHRTVFVAFILLLYIHVQSQYYICRFLHTYIHVLIMVRIYIIVIIQYHMSSVVSVHGPL